MKAEPENISNAQNKKDEIEWEIDYTDEYSEVTAKLGPGWEPFSVVLVPGYSPELRIYWKRKVIK